jgi:tetratricopeptide (TPR) repeat protein
MAKMMALPTVRTIAGYGQGAVRDATSFTDGVFVGREREMAALRTNLEDAFAGCGRLVLLVGEPGIGKTRTAHELTAHALMRGARVFTGRCYEGEGTPPFWPWVQIVRTYLHDCDLDTLQADMGAGAVDITQVIPEVRKRLPKLPPSLPLESEHIRFRFFDSYTTFLKNVACAQPLMLVLDDLHWADASSLLLLQFLVQELGNAPLLVVGTYRDVALELHHPLRQTLGELVRAQRSQTIELRGLTEGDVASFIQSTTGFSPDATLLTAVHQQTEGNPFFLTEVVRLLASEGQQSRIPTPQSVNTLPIPQRVYDMISRRLAYLSDDCLRVLTLASVIGRGFTLEVLTRASGLPRSQILQALEEAIVARIITDDRQTIGSYSFSHALMRETLYKELTLTQRVTFHRKVGEALENLSDAYPQPPLTELAYHFSIAAQSGTDVEKAIAYATQAGARAAVSLAYEEAAKHYQSAHRLLDLQEPDEAMRCELLLALGDTQRRAGQLTQARETFLAASNVARRLEQPRQFARAALGFAGLWVAIGVVDRAVVALLEEALQSLGEEEDMLRARLYARLATEFWFATSREQRVTFSQEAVRLARHTADQKTLGYCLQAHHLALWGSPHLEERLVTTAEILQLAEQTRDPELALHGYSRRIADLLEAGDLFAVDAAVAVHARLAEALRRPEYLWYTVVWKGMRTIMAGQFEEGERLAQQALVLGQQSQVSHDDAVLGFGIQLFTIRREQGRLPEMESALKGFIEQYPAISTLRCALAYLHSEVGQEAEAHERFEELARQGFTDLPQDMTFPLSLAFLAHVCVFLGDTCRATQLYALLLPYAACNVVTSAAIAYNEPAAHSLGILAVLLEQWDEAQTHFAAAIAMNTRLGARPRLADAQYAYANLLLTRQQSGDREQAITFLDSALTTAQELGMTGLVEKIQGLGVRDRGSVEDKSTRPANDILSIVEKTQSLIPNVFRHEGDYWTITYRETSFRLSHIRGLDYIAQLLKHPNIEFYVLDLVSRAQKTVSSSASVHSVALVEPSAHVSRLGGAEVLLDAQAREAYKQRLRELREELEEAHSFNDLGRADKAQREIDFISSELTRGLGLRGRPRSVSSPAERARVNVVKGIKAASAKIAEHSPLLEHYLATTIKTGLFCSYTPHPFNPISWDF